MKKLNLLAISAAVAGAVVSGSAMASDLTGNLGVANNYLWRGVTQNADEAAVTGGIDFSHDSGAYAGTWVSNLANGSYELDVYGGYAGEAGSVAYDVGYVMYLYPLDVDLDFSEIYGGVDIADFGVDVAITIDSDAGGDDQNIYVSADYTFELKEGLSLALLVGNYDFEAAGATDYTHFSATLAKDDFAFALEQNDITGDDDMRVVVSWGKEFAL